MPEVLEPILAPPEPGPSFAGEWLYNPSGQTVSPVLYPPEYIQLRLREIDGVIQGRYQARYRVRDQAISPVVFFEFESPPNGDGLRARWTGPGGARGEVTLRLMDTRRLDLKWQAMQLGTELGLIAGSATLVRRAE